MAFDAERSGDRRHGERLAGCADRAGKEGTLQQGGAGSGKMEGGRGLGIVGREVGDWRRVLENEVPG